MAVRGGISTGVARRGGNRKALEAICEVFQPREISSAGLGSIAPQREKLKLSTRPSRGLKFEVPGSRSPTEGLPGGEISRCEEAWE